MAPRLVSLALLLFPALSVAGHAKTWIDKFDPLPNPDSVFTIGNARFTVLTEGAVRIEYSASKLFNDESTIAVLHRNLPKTSAVSMVEDDTLTIETHQFELTYNSDPALGPGFTSANLNVRLLVAPHSTWVPGAAPTGNLHGTIRTLDRVGAAVTLACAPVVDAVTYMTHCEEGFASRDGWVVVDDTLRPRFDRESVPDWTWVKGPRPEALSRDGYGGVTDLYFFGWGLNHTATMGDWVKLSGPIPLMPRYALGPQFSRWYAYGELDSLVNVQSGFSGHGIPLDVLVIDMDWHYTYDHGYENPYGVKVEGWTGYTFWPPLFPSPGHFFKYLAARGVATTLNKHPAAGVQFHEANYAAMATHMGMDPAKGQTVAFDIANVTYAKGLFSIMLKPIDDAGMTFWWIDYQQTPFSTVPMLNPTFQSNYAWWTQPWRYGQYAPPERADDRPYLMGRWGGLGGHRYTAGFVGDTYSRWNVLRYETYFIPTASNVHFSWTNDVGGFAGVPSGEMFVRWVQFAVFCPVFRTHSHKSSPARALWTFPNPVLSLSRGLYRLRARLLPYIVAAQRHAYDTGVQVVRPMYWLHPDVDAAYSDTAQHQFYFGPDIWTAPIAAPAPNGTGGLTNWTFWVPPGRWIEWGSFDSVAVASPAGAFVTRNYSLSEMPVFSPEGAVVPMRPMPGDGGGGVLGLASKPMHALEFVVFPLRDRLHGPGGVPSLTTRARLYDDDGLTLAYEHSGAFAWTDVTCTWTAAGSDDAAGDAATCVISPPVGKGYEGFPAERTYTLRFPGSFAPKAVSWRTVVDGAEASAGDVEYDPYAYPDPEGEDAKWAPGTNAWSYEGTTLSTWVHLGVPQPTHGAAVTVTLTLPRGARADDPLLTSGFARKVRRVLACKEEFDQHYGIIFPVDWEGVLGVSASARRLASEHSPHATRTALAAADPAFSHGLALMARWGKGLPPQAKKFKPALRVCQAAIADALQPQQTVPEPPPELVDARSYAEVMSQLGAEYGMGGV